jgi:hypothetical protein
MSTAAQVSANKINGALSHGPITQDGKARSSMNGLRDGLRAKTLILPGENRQEFERDHQQWIEDLQPCDGTEHLLVHEIASAYWLHLRVKRAQYQRLKTCIEGDCDREDEDVEATLERLFTDAGRPNCMYGISTAASGGPRTSSPENVDDSQKPAALVKRLEATAKGCQALIENWKGIAERVEQKLEIQSHDRLKTIRMLGKQPLDCAQDQRVWLIFVASFALHPAGKDHAFEDLTSDLGTIELEGFLDRILSRWGLLLDASDTPKAKQTLLDLIARNVERLEAKREAHLEHADENAASSAERLAYEESPQGERLARHELASQRRAHRCVDAFWKYRREKRRHEEDGGRKAEDGGQAYAGENVPELRGETGVAEAGSGAPGKNLTSEPKRKIAASQVAAEKAVEAAAKELDRAFDAFLATSGAGIGPFGAQGAGGGTVRAAIEAAIFAGKPLFPPIERR